MEIPLLLLVLTLISAQFESHEQQEARLHSIVMGHSPPDMNLAKSKLSTSIPYRINIHPNLKKNYILNSVVKIFPNDDLNHNNKDYASLGEHSPQGSSREKNEYKNNLDAIPFSYANIHLNNSYKTKSQPASKALFIPATETPTFESLQAFDRDPSYFKHNFKLQDVPNLYDEKRFEGIASKGQIEKYLENQQKILDEVIELQLLNDPNPESKGKYHQFLKAKDDERIEKEYEENLKKKPVNQYEANIPRKTSKRPQTKNTRKKTQSTPGLGHYRTPKVLDSYELRFDF